MTCLDKSTNKNRGGSLYIKDTMLKKSIRNYFNNIGNISLNANYSTVEFRVNTLEDLTEVIFPHFLRASTQIILY